MSALESHTISYRIYAEDVDHMGIVYHSNYLYFFERARTESLRTKSYSLTQLAQQGTHFAIKEAQLKFLYPARLDDLVQIKTEVEHLRPTLLGFHQFMYNQAGKLLCEGTISVVCLNEKYKPKRLPFSINA